MRTSIVVLFFLMTAFCSDMILQTGSGENIVLRDNYTWEFEKDPNKWINDDFTITLGDGRIILIGANNDWQFVKKEDLEKKDILPVKKILGKGTGSNSVHANASAKATNSAITNATKKFKSVFKKRKLNYAKLRDCIRRVEKETDQQDNFVKGKGWDVTVEITLEEGSILAVLDCECEKTQKK